ncbi:MAG: hypothetical protein QGH83_06975 [Candidatus Pacebacteria bacterium]|nr:hypothetical protein [Candidatus Paceibacterota bacterium]
MPSSGPISLGQTNTETNKSATAEVSLNDADVRTLFDRASGEISLLHGRGKAWTVDIEYVVVAGGGGGGYGRGGGGGAGGFRFVTGLTHTTTTVAQTITVGAGGASGTQGSNSVLGSVISTGGGNGWGEYGGTQNNDLDGGSGGDGINDSGTFGTLTYQGHDGGDYCYCSDTHRAGGGGGATTVGDTPIPPQQTTGHGGHGASTSITGSVVTIAGGGGGGGNWGSGSGRSGGGNGVQWNGGTGGAGTVNTGSGGGGGSGGTSRGLGGVGGSGVIYLKISDTNTAVFSSGVTSSLNTSVSGFKIYTVTATSTTSETVTIS